MKKRLGDILVEEGVITVKQLENATSIQKTKGGKLGDILVGLRLCKETDILEVLAKRAGIPFVTDFTPYLPIAADVLYALSPSVAAAQKLLPLRREKNLLTVAVADPFANLDVVDELKIQTGCSIKTVLASESLLLETLEKAYAATPRPAAKAAAPAAAKQAPAAASAAGDAVIDTILNTLIENAAKSGADHVFVEPTEEALRVRYRIRGVLETRSDIPLLHQVALTARAKTLARLNAAECWLPQEGRLRRDLEGSRMDVKLATLPTSLGEKLVFSLIDPKQSLPLDLAALGLSDERLNALKELLSAGRGLFLVAGPAASGKTTTLYALLASLNGPDKHVVTIEDPVERYLDGVTQLQVRADARLDLASGLHVLRRQDPDVVLVSEIRDLETAEAAAYAATAKTLVLSSINASDALGALQRLMDMGLPPSLLASSLSAIISQRLIRTVCPNCTESYRVSMRELMTSGVTSQEVRGAKRSDSFTLFRGKGCGQCLGTGYLGRAAVFEVFVVNDAVRRLMWDRASIGQVARETAESMTLREAAVQMALAGKTSLEEALRLA